MRKLKFPKLQVAQNLSFRNSRSFYAELVLLSHSITIFLHYWINTCYLSVQYTYAIPEEQVHLALMHGQFVCTMHEQFFC